MTTPAAEREEVGAARSIDEEFTRFYKLEHAGQVRRATLILGSDADADDIVHAAFLEVYRRWARIREPGPYLSRAVLNGCRDVGRRQKNAMRAARSLHAVGVHEIDEMLFDVLDSLPFNQRASVVLRFYVGMTEQEIADALGARPGSVGPWISRGLARMRKELE